MSFSKTRVGVLRGGNGRHYHGSLEKGAAVITHLFENLGDKYKVFDIFIDKNNNWHIGGVPLTKESLPRKVDMVWDSTHNPEYSKIVSHFSIPVVRVSDFYHSLTNNREILSKHLDKIGVKTTRSIVLPIYQEDFDGEKESYAKNKAKEVWQKFPAPWIVKSYTPDSNMAIHLAKTFDELVRAILDGIDHKQSILIEEFVTGKVGALHIVPGFRKNHLYTLIPMEFSPKEKNHLEKIAHDIHNHLQIEHYLKIDFVLHPKLGFHLLSLDFMPDTRPGSHFVELCERLGAKMHHVIDHILEKIRKN